jgi:hypothetical protein
MQMLCSCISIERVDLTLIMQQVRIPVRLPTFVTEDFHGFSELSRRILGFRLEFSHDCVPLTELNSVAVVRKQTIPTKRSPLVGEVSANLCR